MGRPSGMNWGGIQQPQAQPNFARQAGGGGFQADAPGPGYAQGGVQKTGPAEVRPTGPISANLGGAGGPPTSMPGGPMDMGNRPMPGMPAPMPAGMPMGQGMRPGMPVGNPQQNPNLAWMNNPNPAQQRWMQEDGVFGPGTRQQGGPMDMGNRPMAGPGPNPNIPVGNLGAARAPNPMQPPARPMGQGMPPQGAPMPQPGQPQGQGQQGLGWMSQPNAAQQRWMNDPQNAQMMQLFGRR